MSTNSVPGISPWHGVWRGVSNRALFWGIVLILLSLLPLAVGVVQPHTTEENLLRGAVSVRATVILALFISGCGLVLGQRRWAGDLLLVAAATVFVVAVFGPWNPFGAMFALPGASILAGAGAVHLAGPGWPNRD